MSGEAGGWTWILMNIGAVAVLAAALAYGLWTWKVRRSPATGSRGRPPALPICAASGGRFAGHRGLPLLNEPRFRLMASEWPGA
jgi:hypothetical protein